MDKKYKISGEESQKVCEPVAYSNYTVQSHAALIHVASDLSNSEKKAYLREHLHPSTVQYLDDNDWMDGKPYPIFHDADSDTWIDEAEALGNTDIVPEQTINQDKAAWHSLR